MISPLYVRTNAAVTTTAAFTSFGQGFVTSGTTNAQAAARMPRAGTLSNMRVNLTNAPGAGVSGTFTIQKNGVDTTLAVTVSDPATSSTNTTDTVSYVAGDTIAIKMVGTASLPTPQPGIFVDDSGVGQALISGSSNVSPSATSVSTSPLQHGIATSAAVDVNGIIPTGGTLSNLNLRAATAPGVGKSWTATLVLNGVDSALTIAVVDNATVNADTTHSVAVVAGDLVQWKLTPAGTPTSGRVLITCQFVPTIDGESIQMYGPTTNLAQNTGNNFTNAANGGSWLTAERGIAFNAGYTLRKLRTVLTAAPGAGTGWRTQMRVNAVATNPSVTITGTNTSGNDSTNTSSPTAGQTVSALVVASTGAPALTTPKMSFVTFRAPVTASHRSLTLTGVG